MLALNGKENIPNLKTPQMCARIKETHPNLSVRASHCQKQMVPSAPVEDRNLLLPLHRGENYTHTQTAETGLQHIKHGLYESACNCA